MAQVSKYCAYAASCGVIPLAPHTIFTQYLNDAVPEQREQGLRMGHELLERCDELWVMGDTISQGMKDEIGLATFLQLPILYVSDDMVKNQKMIRQSDRPLDINDCIPESSQYNYENQFLVLKPGVSSKGKDMTADDSIWYARNGFGCIYGARGQAVYAESLLTGKYIHWERHDFCGIVKPESLKEWLLDKPVRNEAAEELTKFVTPELISAAKQNHTACGYTDMMSRSHLIIIIGLAYNPVLYERVTAACKNRAAPGAAMTGKGHNGTPVQPQPCLRSE